MRFFKNGELEDKKIIAALHQAAEDYENGELIEVRDLLLEIINAIDNFDPEDVSKMFMNCEILKPMPEGAKKNGKSSFTYQYD